jgi:hypothetical protein
MPLLTLPALFAAGTGRLPLLIGPLLWSRKILASHWLWLASEERAVFPFGKKAKQDLWIVESFAMLLRLAVSTVRIIRK